MPTIGTALITKNEAHILGDCLESLQWMDEIVIVDDCSSDRTVEIAEQHGAKVVVSPMIGFGAQRNMAIALSTSDWLFHPDADMVMPPALAQEIRDAVADSQYDAYAVHINNYYLGKQMRHGAWNNKPKIMLARRGIRFVKDIHEKLDISPDKVATLTTPIEHYTDTSYHDRLEKSNLYSDLQAQEWFEQGRRFRLRKFLLDPWKYGLYYYLYRAGFLDGLVGLMHFIHIVFVTYVLYIKIWELERDHGLR